jgi:hypothetical protein
MADIPPVSDPQLAALLEQNKKRRTRAILIFVSVAVVLAVGLGGSATYFSAQAKKKRNVAYSHVVKCLFGKPLDAGEAPMTRVRSAWRARILAEPRKDPNGPGTLEDQEASKTQMWPNRCVAQMVAFTDTLKEVGEMKEGEKDLGFYSRELSKQTAGDNWKNVDTYQAAVESFVSEAEKGKFEFVDVPDVQAPDLIEAQPLEGAFPKSSALEDTRIDHVHVVYSDGASRFFVRAGKGKPARFCTTTDGKELACAAASWLPPEASGNPWVLPAEDGAQPLLAFGRNGGVADGRSISTGVFRSTDGLTVIPADAYYVGGGFARADGSATIVLKDAKDPSGDKFKVARLPPNGSKVELDSVTLTDWNEHPSGLVIVGAYAVWVTNGNQLHARALDDKNAQEITVATLPGRLSGSNNEPAFAACSTKKGFVIAARVIADGAERMLVVPTTASGFGKAQVTDEGDLACSDDGARILADDTMTTCTDDACNGAKLDRKPTAGEILIDVDGTIVRASEKSGLLQIEWVKGGKSIAKKVWDAQMKGTILLGESKLGQIQLIGRRGYGLVLVDLGTTQHIARVDAAGNITPVTLKL